MTQRSKRYKNEAATWLQPTRVDLSKVYLSSAAMCSRSSLARTQVIMFVGESHPPFAPDRSYQASCRFRTISRAYSIGATLDATEART